MTLIFLHIPKAAGNTFLQYLLPNFAADVRFDVNHKLDYCGRLRELEQMPDDKKAMLELVYGHLPFGVHEWLPQQSRYITFLRHPVDRITSHYYFVKEQPTHPLHQALVEKRMSIADYVESGLSGELNNGMTRLLSGDSHVDSLRGHGVLSDYHFNTACRNLESHFAAVCVVEQFSRSLTLLNSVFGWPLRNVEKRNVTQNRIPMQMVPQRDRAAIERKNSLDLALYERVVKMFNEQCLSRGIGAHCEELVSSGNPRKKPTLLQSILRHLRVD